MKPTNFPLFFIKMPSKRSFTASTFTLCLGRCLWLAASASAVLSAGLIAISLKTGAEYSASKQLIRNVMVGLHGSVRRHPPSNLRGVCSPRVTTARSKKMRRFAVGYWRAIGQIANETALFAVFAAVVRYA